MLYDEVMLIRCRPDETGLDRVLGRLRDGSDGRLLMFFQGPGLEWPLSERALQGLVEARRRPTLMLCAAGWRRRGAAPLPEGWQAGSLIQFWDAADRATRLTSFGALGD